MPIPTEGKAGLAVRAHLKPREDRRVLAGYDWIFSNEIASVEGPAEAGVVAEVLSSAGEFVGLAFYNPHSLIAGRIISRKKREIDRSFFEEKLEAALALRKRLRPGASFYRLCFGESDGLPGLVIDRYGSVLVLEILSAGIERHLEDIRAALDHLLKPSGIYLKNDHRSRALEGLKAECRVLCGEVPEKIEVEEGGIRYSVAIGEGQKTGFYFDQAENREFLRPYFPGRTVLDLYSYVGAFALNAAKFGALAVRAVDSSAPALEAARESAKLNGLEGKIDFKKEDAEEVLNALGSARYPFVPDMILLDPPNLVQSKKNLDGALRLYTRLNAAALAGLKRGGLLATSTCSHHVDRELFVGMLRAACAKSRRRVRLLALRAQGGDHPILLSMPETEYLHFALLEVID